MRAWRFSRLMLALLLVLLAVVAATLLSTAYLGSRQALLERTQQDHAQYRRILEQVVATRFADIRRYSQSIAERAELVSALSENSPQRVDALLEGLLDDGQASHIDALVVERGDQRQRVVSAGLLVPSLPLEALSWTPAPLERWTTLNVRWRDDPYSLLRLILPIVEPSLGRVVGRLHTFVVLDDGFWLPHELQRLFGARAVALGVDGRPVDARLSAEVAVTPAALVDRDDPITFMSEGILHGYPLQIGDSDTYRAALLLPDDDFLALRDTYLGSLVYAALLVVAVGVGAMLLLRRLAARSLDDLVRYAEAVPESGTAKPFRGGRFQEFNRVGRAFETMLQRIRERDKYLEGIIQHTPDLIFVKDREERYRLVNDRYAWAVHGTPASLVDTSAADWLEGEQMTQAQATDRRLLEGGAPLQYHASLPTPDGTRHYLITKFPILDDRGEAYLIGGVATDVTDLRQTQEQLQLAQQVFAETAEAIIVLDARQRALLTNRAFVEMSGRSDAHATGVIRDFLLHHPELARALVDGRRWQGQCEFMTGEGERLPVLVSAASLPSEGECPRHMLLFSDISSLKVAEQRLERLAWYDSLTGLANRSLFMLRLDEALQGEASLSVLFIDLDRFKDINDRYGHPLGDELLRQVADRLRTCTQARDTVARFGGDGFAVLLQGVGQEAPAVAIAQRILDALSEPYELGVARCFSTASLGIALAPSQEASAETLIRYADQAMYEAKAQGRQRAMLFEPAIDERHQVRLRMEAGLHQALAAGDELFVCFQPRFDISGHRVVGAEALLRWQSPTRGLVPPSTFIPLAEHSGLIVELGRFVLGEACRQAATWAAAGCAIPVSVNLSPRQLHAADLIRDIHAAIRQAGLPPRMLELELTETHVMDNIDRVLPVLHQIRAMGVGLAIDDFGTGYSSLAYLKRLPVELLKIDRSFLADVPGDADDETLLAAIINMAHNLGFRVLAEGVETERQRRFLAERGCDELQGFLLGHPQSPEQLLATLRRVSGVSGSRI
ncbi:EAL domain-containing protein [Halomonas sp. THAF12]|uniref:EAL domain-containing protein n=1 Tax=Halomonas sp. B23F22_10 TaxID=3459515 RepID=UPI00373F44E8